MAENKTKNLFHVFYQSPDFSGTRLAGPWSMGGWGPGQDLIFLGVCGQGGPRRTLAIFTARHNHGISVPLGPWARMNQAKAVLCQGVEPKKHGQHHPQNPPGPDKSKTRVTVPARDHRARTTAWHSQKNAHCPMPGNCLAELPMAELCARHRTPPGWWTMFQRILVFSELCPGDQNRLAQEKNPPQNRARNQMPERILWRNYFSVLWSFFWPPRPWKFPLFLGSLVWPIWQFTWAVLPLEEQVRAQTSEPKRKISFLSFSLLIGWTDLGFCWVVIPLGNSQPGAQSRPRNLADLRARCPGDPGMVDHGIQHSMVPRSQQPRGLVQISVIATDHVSNFSVPPRPLQSMENTVGVRPGKNPGYGGCEKQARGSTVTQSNVQSLARTQDKFFFFPRRAQMWHIFQKLRAFLALLISFFPRRSFYFLLSS